MMQNSKYTVLMSVYYKEKPEYLSLSIESMLNQTVKPDEFIIVKDGPLTTELDEVINNFVTAYPKTFNIIVNETNLGLGPALAKGIENSKNELIARMDSDDYVVSTRCSTLDIKMWIQLEFVWQSQMTEYIIGLEVWIILLFHQKKNPGMQMQFTSLRLF